jgi:signal peptidase II
VILQKSQIKWLGLALIILVLDQLSKYYIQQQLDFNHPLDLLPWFNFRLLHNTGGAFSFLSTASGWQRWFLSGIALGLIMALCFWLFSLSAKARLKAMGLSLVIGGALGNLLDRVYYGYVIDFIELHYQNWSWPVFNLADSAITLGAFIIMLTMLREN